MSGAAVPSPEVLVTTPGSHASVPPWMREHEPRVVPGEEVAKLRRLPEITVVEASEPTTLLRDPDFLAALARRHSRTPGQAKILFFFRGKRAPADTEHLRDLLRFFARYDDVEFARGAEQWRFAFQEAVAKLRRGQDEARPEAESATGEGRAASNAPRRRPPAARVVRRRSARSPRDPIGEVAEVIAATRDLRAPSGRLSAKAVADAFGLPAAEVARILGRSRQAVGKTDDAESLQEGLAPWARIVRLRAVLSGDDFRAWLRTDSELLDDRPPLAWVREGRAGVVADLVDDMLSGSPT
jgi:hypothetical protein